MKHPNAIIRRVNEIQEIADYRGEMIGPDSPPEWSIANRARGAADMLLAARKLLRGFYCSSRGERRYRTLEWEFRGPRAEIGATSSMIRHAALRMRDVERELEGLWIGAGA